MFERFVGEWEGISRTWFEPGKLADESTWQATIYSMLDGRYLRYEYRGTLQGERFEGKATIGYNTMTKQFEMAWIDSFHQNNGIMYCRGPQSETGFSVLGSYCPVEGSEDWGWRTVFDLTDADHLTVRAYNIEPNGTEHLGIETHYTRR
jgi:hypothetical protein